MADVDRLKQQIEADRAELRNRLDRMGRELTPDGIVSGAAGMIRDGSLGHEAARIAQSRAAPLALTGAGLGWFLVNAATSGSRTSRPRAPTSQKGQDDMTPSARDTARHLKNRGVENANRLRARIDEGLEDLDAGARARVRRAREAAINAQSEVERRAHDAADYAREAARENPLLIGALAFAAGAALAAALPRSSVENRTIGQHRDRLFDEAERVLREEMENAKGKATDAVAKGQERIADNIRDAADTVSDAADKAAKSGRSGTSTGAV